MKLFTSSLFLVVLMLPLFSSGADADTEAARALKELQAQRDKELAVAAEPVNRRYQQGLEQLLRRAMQANDVDTAVKIRAALAVLPQVVGQQLAGDWTLMVDTGYRANFTLRADGTGTRSDGGRCQWRVDGTWLRVGGGGGEPPTDKADKFQLPIVDNRLKGVNSIGNSMTLTKK